MKTSGLATILILGVGAAMGLDGCGANDVSPSPGSVNGPNSGGTSGANAGGTPSTTLGSGGAAGTGDGVGTGGAMSAGGASGIGNMMGVGGATDAGGANGGGGRSTGGCPLPEPTWAIPSVPNPAVCAGAAPPPMKKWLDDLDGDTFTPSVMGWNIAADTTNGQCIVPQGGGAAGAIPLTPWGSHDASSKYGLQLQAYIGCSAPAGANNWGAQWQFQTEPKKTGRAVFDLSPYAGIVMWARLAGAPGKGNMSAAFMTPQTTPADFGGDGTCGTAASPALCFGYYQAAAKVGQTCWAPIVIKFSDLQPSGPAPASGFDQARVFGLQLAASAWDTAAKTNFPVDILVDDIYLY